MIQRCHYPKSVSFKYYGAKGVSVCERWKNFENFLNDMGGTWRPELTLERIDNSKGYFPTNCRWASTHEQRMNDAHGKVVTVRGVTKRLASFATDLGISNEAIHGRLKRGWSIEDACTRPKGNKGRKNRV